MNTFEIALLLTILFAMFFTGYMVGEVKGQYVADSFLIEQVQDLMAERNGYKQLYETANKGICTREYQFAQVRKVSEDENRR